MCLESMCSESVPITRVDFIEVVLLLPIRRIDECGIVLLIVVVWTLNKVIEYF